MTKKKKKKERNTIDKINLGNIINFQIAIVVLDDQGT